MDVPQQQSPTIICAENIALLQFLHNVPAQPSTRNLHAAVADDGPRALSLKQERHHTSLEVLVAVNKSELSDGDGYLGSVCDGLGRIFNTLSRATREAHDRQLEYEVFIDIVAVCRERILSRLRFGKHKSGKTKAPLRNVLRSMCDAVASITHQDARAFLEGTRRLIAALNRFENHQVDAELSALVEETDSWTQMGNLTSLFRKVPSSALSGASCDDYRGILSKIGQYRTAARRLYHLARNVSALRSATIRPIRLGPDAFVRPNTTEFTPSLAETLSRVSAQKTKRGLATTLSNVMRKHPLSADEEFTRNTRRILAQSKLHAEVQILVYLKSLPPQDTLATRVVQSNKKACFLCDELLALNGLPGVPKSHGRLYSGWMLPPLPGLKQLQLQLNESLQRPANQSIAMALKKGQKIDLVYPVESTALTVSEAAVTGTEESDLVPAPCEALLRAYVLEDLSWAKIAAKLKRSESSVQQHWRIMASK